MLLLPKTMAKKALFTAVAYLFRGLHPAKRAKYIKSQV
jgi:hypothetical protein